MSDWLHDLPVLWMAVVIFSFTYALSAIILFVVIALGAGDRARSFKAMSPGILSPLGVIFGLFVAFTAAQVWNDSERAATAVNREASALRNVVILATAFPGQTEQLLRSLIRDYIEETSRQEWPLMARHAASLRS